MTSASDSASDAEFLPVPLRPQLPVISGCDGCCACCLRTPIPPFEPGEEAARDVPDAWLAPVRQRIAADQQFDLLPCVWLEPTTGLCQHYDHRPQACRSFEVGGDLCRLSRWDAGLP